MNVLIAYDINIERHGELKNKLIESGFYETWSDVNHNTFELPDTTLWIPRVMKPSHAKSIFDEAIENLNHGEPADNKIEVTKFIAVQATMFLGIPSNNNAE